jgi:hypothetical protein
MLTTQTKSRCSNRKLRNSIKIQTSLYELMETVIDSVNPDENRLIKEVTLNLLAKARPRIRVTGH